MRRRDHRRRLVIRSTKAAMWWCLQCNVVFAIYSVSLLCSLKVDFTGSSDKVNKYVVELEGAKFIDGKCDGARVDNDVTKDIEIPKAAGSLQVRAAWASRDRKVRFDVRVLTGRLSGNMPYLD